MEINTTSYEFAHGHKPRGFGMWMFQANGFSFRHAGNYGDAKKAAKAHFAAMAKNGPAIDRHTRIEVCS